MGLTAQLSGMRVRLRLTLLYGGLFLLSGAVLLAITYVLVTHSGPNVAVSASSTTPSGGQQSVTIFLGEALPPNVRLPEAERRITQALQEQAAQQHTEIKHQLLVKSGMALAIMSVIAVALGWLVAGRVLRPLR